MQVGQTVPGSAPGRVLVVDDSPVIRDLIAVNLALEGLDVTTAEDGPDALARLESALPDLVTLDVRMPGLDGFEVLARLRADRRTADLPVVVVSGRSAVGDLARAEELGASAYVTKPFEPADLVAVVLRLIRSPASGAGAPPDLDTLEG